VELFTAMGTSPKMFPESAVIFIVKEGKLQKYQGFIDVPAELFHHMQRYADPIVKLKTLEEVEAFMNTKTGSWKSDNTGSLVVQGSID